jgi:serine protease inhibitor ecotin
MTTTTMTATASTTDAHTPRAPRHDEPSPRRDALSIIRHMQAEFSAGDLSFEVARVEDLAVIGCVRHRCGGRLEIRMVPHWGYWDVQPTPGQDVPDWHVLAIMKRARAAADRQYRAE